jgi:hypothetical protein
MNKIDVRANLLEFQKVIAEFTQSCNLLMQRWKFIEFECLIDMKTKN